MEVYYNPFNIHLSGREYIVLEEYPNGKKLITFPSFGGEAVIASPKDLDETHRKRCEEIIQQEKEQIWRDHGWI